MKVRNLFCITAEDDHDYAYIPRYDHMIRNIVDNIKEKKVTLKNLKALQELKKDYKKNF